MKLGLLALTGFGNTVLSEVVEGAIFDEIVVFTRSEKGPFPYYPCEPLSDLCRRVNVEVHVDRDMCSEEVCKFMAAWEPDMLLVATFPKKIPVSITSIPSKGALNIHPSLLPEYRGPTPTNWCVINGERQSGVTFHRVSARYDCGDILAQETVSIEKLTDGEARKRLAELAGKMIQPFFVTYLNGTCIPIPQDPHEGSYYPKITSREGLLLLKSGGFCEGNLIRGLTPYPGVRILG